MRLHGRTKYAVEEILRICLEDDILETYLKGREKEVKDIMFTLYDEDEIMRRYMKTATKRATQEAREQGIIQGREEGREEGREQEKKSLIISFAKQGVPQTAIAAATGLTMEQVEKIIANPPYIS